MAVLGLRPCTGVLARNATVTHRRLAAAAPEFLALRTRQKSSASDHRRAAQIGLLRDDEVELLLSPRKRNLQSCASAPLERAPRLVFNSSEPASPHIAPQTPKLDRTKADSTVEPMFEDTVHQFRGQSARPPSPWRRFFVAQRRHADGVRRQLFASDRTTMDNIDGRIPKVQPANYSPALCPEARKARVLATDSLVSFASLSELGSQPRKHVTKRHPWVISDMLPGNCLESRVLQLFAGASRAQGAGKS